MQTVQWITFGLAQSLSKTTVHFFPSAAGIAAPYPVVTRLSCFRAGECQKSVTVEGLRLQQPDGIVIDELFPFLQEQSTGLFGLEMTLGCGQPRVDLSRSNCFVELRNKSAVTKFRPTMVQTASDKSDCSTGMIIKDAYLNTSLVFVNGTEQEMSPGLSGSGAPIFQCSSVAPLSILEVVASESALDKIEPRQFGWGMSRLQSLALSEPIASGGACYLMYRDAVSRFPLSVRQL